MTARRRGGALVLDVDGDLDISTGEALRAAVTAALHSAPGACVVVLDLEGTMFCGARGLAVLLEITEDAARRGVEVILVQCPISLERLVGLLRLGSRLRTGATVTEVLDDGVATPDAGGRAGAVPGCGENG